MMRSRGGTRDASDTMTPSPPWIAMGLLTVAFAVPLALAMSPRTGLYWYIFPLFSIGITYVVQFRTQFSPRWKATFVATAVLSVVALALDWPFSGHVLWNVLFIGHAYLTGKRRSAWMALLFASLVYLVVLKLVSQTGRDVVGAFISIAVALVVLLLLRERDVKAPG